MKDTKLPIAVWLGMLPEPMREKAIINHLLYPVFLLDIEAESLSESIFKGFSWDKTFEKYEFWHNFYLELKSQDL